MKKNGKQQQQFSPAGSYSNRTMLQQNWLILSMNADKFPHIFAKKIISDSS